MMNPFGISGSWRVDPDNRQDRGCSKVTSYKLSPEEIEALIKNSKVPAQKKPQAFSQSVSEVSKIRLEADEIMKKISRDELLMECQQLGCNMDAYKDIAKRYGFTNWHSVECAVSKHGIKKMLEKESKAKTSIT